MGRIVHGNKNFGYAPINVVESGGVKTYSFGTPVMLPGMVSMEVELDSEAQNIYADDRSYCVIRGAKVRTATGTFRYITSAYAQYLGYKLNTNGMLSDTGTHANHCIFFETEEYDDEAGIETRTLHYLYKANGGEPSRSSETDEDDVSAEEIEVEYNCSESDFVVDDDGKSVSYAYITRTEENKDDYDAFTSSVILPTTAF